VPRINAGAFDLLLAIGLVPEKAKETVMTAPHPLAAVVQHLVRERAEPRRWRAARRRRLSWPGRRSRSLPAVAPADVRLTVEPEPPQVFEAPPGLALPPIVARLPRPRVSTEQLEQAPRSA
jgi:hypothetical protein